MGNQTSNEDTRLPGSKAELIERIQRSRAALEEALAPLSRDELSTAASSGWSVKDHLAHLAAWELGIAELLLRRPRFEAMGLELAEAREKSEDEINDLIYQQHKDLTLTQVLDKFHTVHRGLLETLEALEDEDLFRPYAFYAVEGGGPRDPVINWIVGNTYSHYDEHLGYIEGLLRDIEV